MKKGILAALTTAAVAGLGLWLSAPGYAAESTYNSYSEALAGAPQGVDLSSDEYKDYFWNEDNGVATGGNMAGIVDAGSPSGAKNSAIRISKASQQDSWGAIWSEKTVFDLSKPETVSMWIYASTEQQYLQKKWGIGDGMAFVLQNSKDGVNAFSKAITQDKNKNDVVTPGVGESMGVWGMDPEDWHKTDLAGNAIDHSWALEFDTFVNNYNPPEKILAQPQWDLDESAPSSFDLGNYYNNFDSKGDPTGTAGTINAQDNHIASNYPGDSSTYTGVARDGYKTNIWGLVSALVPIPLWYTSKYTSSSYYFYKMTHLGYLDEGKNADANTDKMTDHRWHHVTLTYTPPTDGGSIGEMTYVYDDKNSDTGQPKTPANKATVPLKLDEFKQDGQDDWDKKVRWGFTGSTGTSTENNLVVFDQVPGDVENSAKATLSTQDNDADTYSPVDTSSTPTIFGGMPVKLDYTFKRDGGTKDWKDINASLNVPKSITLSSGSITNPDNSTSKVDISKREGTTLPVSLGSDGQGLTLTGSDEAHITLYGTVGTSAATEAEATSYFNGSNASATAKLPAFNVKASDLTMTIAPEESTTSVDYGDSKQPAEIVGQAKYPYGPAYGAAAMSPEDIVVHLKVNGHSQGSKALPNILVNRGSDPFVFQYEVDNSLLKKGANTITLYSTSKSEPDERSNEDSTTVTAGSLGYGDTSGNLVFAPTVLSGTTTTIERANDWSFYIDDSRQSGDWYLSARTTGMTLDTAVDTRLDGNLIYVGSDGTTQTLNADDTTLIDSGKADGTDKKTNIASDWGPKQGILLRVNGSAMQGDYSGEIIWNLSNAPS
ncbi:L-type lectin family protein [Levilactobacillus angrenensis]|uniref:WxL domain-containing protein n=1 Tax=Levilactobacillus angrenensis TaxID=2486020 RepID=A0ABW1UBP2_9LACO|nr:hypothetical protein [Levilactobacillus angrenensis]